MAATYISMLHDLLLHFSVNGAQKSEVAFSAVFFLSSNSCGTQKYLTPVLAAPSRDYMRGKTLTSNVFVLASPTGSPHPCDNWPVEQDLHVDRSCDLQNCPDVFVGSQDRYYQLADHF